MDESNEILSYCIFSFIASNPCDETITKKRKKKLKIGSFYLGVSDLKANF